jgi:hypothetical protein
VEETGRNSVTPSIRPSRMIATYDTARLEDKTLRKTSGNSEWIQPRSAAGNTGAFFLSILPDLLRRIFVNGNERSGFEDVKTSVPKNSETGTGDTGNRAVFP